MCGDGGKWGLLVFVGQLVLRIISRKRLKSFMVTVFINIAPGFRRLASDKSRDISIFIGSI